MLNVLQNLTDSNIKLKTPKAPSYLANDFIPACEHFDAQTLVTKNGELMRTFRICTNNDGLNYEHDATDIPPLRDAIRNALQDCVQTDNVSFWIHTLRKQEEVVFEQNFTNPFAAYVHQKWRKKHDWSFRFYNEVYVTVLYDGQSTPMFDKQTFKETLRPSKNRAFRNHYLDAISNELNLIVDGLIAHISQHYEVHPLCVVQRIPAGQDEDLPAQPIYYSEPMEFLSYLLNLRAEEVPLPEASIHNSLQSCNLVVGFNALETKNDAAEKRFGAILSLKNYREIPPHTVDMLLQSPIQLIISQSFHFIPADDALKQYREQREYFETSEDSYSMEATGLFEILSGNQKRPTDFIHQQTSFMVIVDELKQLDIDIGKLQEAFGEIGLVCVREDIRLEEVFWSTLPGNFEFLRRKDPINGHLAGGFARLNRFASGQSTGTLWSQPIGLLPTLVNSPYFFNFHVQDNGHTLWLDFNSFNDKAGICTLSFLLTQTQKLRTKLFYFDCRDSAALWFKKMDFPYHVVNSKTPDHLSINPFSLPEDPRNLGFLAAWCCLLIDATDAEKEQILEHIRAFFETSEPRTLASFITFMSHSDPALATRFRSWGEGGNDKGWFEATANDITADADWQAFNMDEAMENPRHAIAVFSFLLHRIILSLDGSPTILVLHDMMGVLSHPFFASRLESLLAMLTESNAMIVFAENANNPAQPSKALDILKACCPTIIAVPDDIKQDYDLMAPGILNESDRTLLWRMERMRGDILVKQGREVVALRIGMNRMEDIAAIYSNDIKTLVAAGGPYSTASGGAHGTAA